MKKTISILVLIAGLVLIGLNTSCSKTKTKEYEKLIVGMWQRDSHEFLEFTNGGSFVWYVNGKVVETGSFSIIDSTISLCYSDGLIEKCTIVNLDQMYLELDNDGGERIVFRRTS